MTGRGGRFLRRGLLLLSAGVFVVAAAGACLPFSAVRHQLDGYAGDGSADAYTPAVHDRFRLGLMIVAATAAGAFAVVLWSRHLSSDGLQPVLDHVSGDGRRLLTDLQQLITENAGALVATLLVATAFRVPHLDAPIRYDEAHTYVKYASQPAFYCITRYDEPNNHILHSLLVHVSTRLFGDGLVAIRLPALCAGIALAVLAAFAGAALAGRPGGWLAGLLVALWPAAIEYSVNARGYMPASALLLVAGLAAGYAVSRSNVCAALIASVSAALCLWTIPSMLYGVVALLIAIDVDTSRDTGAPLNRARICRLLAWGAATAVLTLLLWLPTILAVGWRDLLAIGAGRPLAWNDFLNAIPDALRGLYDFLLRDVPLPVQCLLLAGLIAAMFAHSALGHRSRAGLAGLLVVLLLLTLQRAVPPARTWTILIAPLAIAATAGWSHIVCFERRSRVWQLSAAIVGIAAVTGLGWTAWRSDWISSREYDGVFREAAQVVEYLSHAARPEEPVIAVTPASAPLVYYARRSELTEVHFRVPDSSAPPETAIVVCATTIGQSPLEVLTELKLQDLYPPADAREFARLDGATLYRVPSFPMTELPAIDRR
jgi:hypothetical protein